MKQEQSFLMVVSRVLGADDDRHSIGTRYSHLQNTLPKHGGNRREKW